MTLRHKSHLEERNQQVEGHRGFTQTIDPKLVNEWEIMCQKWENDRVPKTAKNPYHTEGLSESFGPPTLLPSMQLLTTTCLGLSEADVRKELAKEEEARLSNGGYALHQTSPAAFLSLGLELEDLQ